LNAARMLADVATAIGLGVTVYIAFVQNTASD